MNYRLDYWIENKYRLHSQYERSQKKFEKILELLTKKFEKLFEGSGCNAQIKGRIKNFDALYRKLLLKSQNDSIEFPFDFITDIVGMRIVVPFLEDLDSVEKLLRENFEISDTKYKSRELSIREFGYDSIHLLIKLPEEVSKKFKNTENMKIEIQLRTILQDAWAEVEHELIYKTSIDKVEDTIRRKMIAVNATLSLGDTIFQEIRDYQRKRYKDIQERHKKLMDKVSTIPEKMEKMKVNIEPVEININPAPVEEPKKKILPRNITDSKDKHQLNDLLMEAMNAHLENRLRDAIELYTELILISPNHFIYNHRGLVYFTLSEYDKAISDFTKAIEMEPKDTRVYTNRGLTFRMLKRYDDSLKDFNKSLELNPLWPDTFYGRSLTYYDLGDIQRALEDCDRAISIKPDFKQAQRFKQFILNQQMK
ncbi:MAG TPA: tetratricopeptide repeat protein [Spirochaetota bacterium]|nr:tetratricopeptide repeat protein [Spirochaetota bacterium]HPJ36279.1 tetratricopeptide repeat protein [Spirochaetota bacterium]